MSEEKKIIPRLGRLQRSTMWLLTIVEYLKEKDMSLKTTTIQTDSRNV